MARANKAFSLGISALVVIALILIVGFGLFLNATFNSTSTTTSNVGTTYTSTIGSTNTSSLTSTVKTLSKGSIVTVTEYVSFSGYATYNITISGSCTLGGGTEMVQVTSTTTKYVTPTNVIGASSTTDITITSWNFSSTIVSSTTLTKTTSTSACPIVG